MSPLTDVLKKYAERGSDGLRPAVDEIAQHGYLLEHLHGLVKNHDNLTIEPPRAYRHPNGFTKIRLATLGLDRWALRLHLWEKLSRDRDIHCHRWNFASRVLRGSIIEKTYALSPEAGPWHAYSCTPSAQGSYLLSFQRACRIETAGRDRYQPGDSYQRDAETLHTARAGQDAPALTLFLQGTTRAATSRVVRPASGDFSGDDVSFVVYSQQEIRELLQEILKTLSDG